MIVEIGRRTSFLLAQERSGGLLFHEDLQDKAVAIKAKAKINQPKMTCILGLLANQGKECGSSATNLDT